MMCDLNVAVLDFTMQLMETGIENDTALALIVFSLQYVLVNHEYWKYRVKHTRWRITSKVLLLFLLWCSSWLSLSFSIFLYPSLPLVLLSLVNSQLLSAFYFVNEFLNH